MELRLVHERSRVREARFEALLGVVAEPLHRYLRRRADASAIDDVLAETMLVLWRRLEDVPGIDAEGSVDPDEALPWCYGVTRGCLANAHRAERRRLRLVERLTRTAEPSREVAADHLELHRALELLGALDREVVRLWAWEGLTPSAIAQVTGLTANAASIRLHRAKKKIAARLERKNPRQAGHRTDEEGSRW
ncbi:RNA polymerase sigma factor [Streptomyces sp. NPDC088354]|uniref:RNA polymerase sigma factor n=1 Tax=unclassified Streptomyces TaxID=2593676 RepID=UPI0029B6F781|nr:sigma-70 family RNA polymerase sigma factor [Streptomyces sp. MI02-7b]MDX3077651.1 sigma-70 family RNA polymerase sigma factor [Streptomyces sp. MI02-7b]